MIDGAFYTIFANGEALVQSNRSAPDWAITVTCDAASATCTRSQEGAVPQEAQQTALLLEQCLLRPEIADIGGQDIPSPEMTAAPAATPTTQAAPPETCGLAALPQGEPGITLQRLLARAGADPGPIDGFPGKRTQAAVVQILGPSGATMPLTETIAALDHVLCAPVR